MISDRELVQKIKPELKRLNLTKEQRITIAIVIKRNSQHMDECVEYLRSVNAKTDGDEIQSKIIDICY